MKFLAFLMLLAFGSVRSWLVDSPTGQPSGQPTGEPSGQPTGQPSVMPSSQPTSRPTGQPTGQPSTQPSGQPTALPTNTFRPTSLPTKADPTGQPTSMPTRYGDNSLTGVAGNQTYYCHSEQFMRSIENSWQTVYIHFNIEHYLLDYINITVHPYEEGIDYLRLFQGDHEKFIFTSVFTNGNLQIKHFGGGSFWYTDFIAIANRVQYLFKRDPMRPNKCMEYHNQPAFKYVLLSATDTNGLVSDKLLTTLSIQTAALLFTEENVQVISNENTFVAYEVSNPSQQDTYHTNITYSQYGQ